MTCGVLALQGAFVEHEERLALLGEKCVELKCADDLRLPFDRLVLPGGESTVQSKLLRTRSMLEPLRQMILAGMPTLGTCAGLILLAQQVTGGVPALATMPVKVLRNAYGRQLASFHTTAAFSGLAEDGTSSEVPMTFIRAPYIEEVGEDVRSLAEVDGICVAAQYGKQIGLAFHPELDNDLRIHSWFLSL